MQGWGTSNCEEFDQRVISARDAVGRTGSIWCGTQNCPATRVCTHGQSQVSEYTCGNECTCLPWLSPADWAAAPQQNTKPTHALLHVLSCRNVCTSTRLERPWLKAQKSNVSHRKECVLCLVRLAAPHSADVGPGCQALMSVETKLKSPSVIKQAR